MSLVCDREASPSDRGQWFSLPCRPPPRPLHRWKCPPAGPENNLCAPVPALSRSHPSVAVWLLNCGHLNNVPSKQRCSMSAQSQKPIDFATERLCLALPVERNCGIRVQNVQVVSDSCPKV